MVGKTKPTKDAAAASTNMKTRGQKQKMRMTEQGYLAPLGDHPKKGNVRRKKRKARVHLPITTSSEEEASDVNSVEDDDEELRPRGIPVNASIPLGRIGEVLPNETPPFKREKLQLIQSRVMEALPDVILNVASCEFLGTLKDDITLKPGPTDYTEIAPLSICIPLLCLTKQIIRSHMLEDVGRMQVKTKGKLGPRMYKKSWDKLGKYRCYVFWFRPKMIASGRPQPEVDQNIKDEKKLLSTFFCKQFELQTEDKKTVEHSLAHSQTFYVAAYDNSHTKIIVAAISFASTVEGVYVNWLAVSKGKRHELQFGSDGNNKPWTSLGLGCFLLKLLQVQQASSGGCSTNIYLQANMGEPATRFYKNRGFVKAPRNDPTGLPLSLAKLVVDSAQGQYSNGYIYFVSDEQNRERTNLEQDPSSCYLHLFILIDKIRQRGESSFKQPIIQPLVPPLTVDDLMTELPFHESARVIDEAMNDLVFYGDPMFGFRSKSDNMTEIVIPPMSKRTDEDWNNLYSSAKINASVYDLMRNVVTRPPEYQPEERDAFLREDHIEHFARWLLRDRKSLLSQSIEIINSYVSKNVVEFFRFDYPSDQFYEQSYFNLRFLYGHPELLEKRFVFMPYNEECAHWWGWVAINPWVAVVKAYRKQTDDDDDDESFDPNEYLHGLMGCNGGMEDQERTPYP